MNGRYSELVRRLKYAVLEGDGAVDPCVRKAVESRAAGLGGRSDADAVPVPTAMDAFVDQVATRAYEVTDAHFDALREAGYSEDAIFEIMVSAALGAALGRLERGLAALNGEG